jgi:hypothetical protein
MTNREKAIIKHRRFVDETKTRWFALQPDGRWRFEAVAKGTGHATLSSFNGADLSWNTIHEAMEQWAGDPELRELKAPDSCPYCGLAACDHTVHFDHNHVPITLHYLDESKTRWVKLQDDHRWWYQELMADGLIKTIRNIKRISTGACQDLSFADLNEAVRFWSQLASFDSYGAILNPPVEEDDPDWKPDLCFGTTNHWERAWQMLSPSM